MNASAQKAGSSYTCCSCSLNQKMGFNLGCCECKIALQEMKLEADVLSKSLLLSVSVHAILLRQNYL